MARTIESQGGWPDYLARFHARSPGITERILGAARSDGINGGINPYEWLLEAVPARASLLDLACGSAPLLGAGWGGRWAGVDRSPAEVTLASVSAGRRVVTADALALPFYDDAFGAVACSMAMMLLDPLDDCLREAARVLVPGGVMVLLLPGGAGPLTARDVWRWARVLSSLRVARLTYPNDRLLRRPDRVGAVVGMRVLSDERRRFVYRMDDPQAGVRFVDSLYLPQVPEARIEAGRRLVAGWTGAALGIPLRRVVLGSPPRGRARRPGSGRR